MFLLSLTVDADLAVPIFVCGVEECCCLSVSQISALLRKALQYKPEKSPEKGHCRTLFMQDIDCIHYTVFWAGRASFFVYRSDFVSLCVPHLSSSSSMKPLPSTSRTWKTFLTFSADIAFIPTISKNFLGSNVSPTKGQDRRYRLNHQTTLTSTFTLASLKCFGN